VIYLGGKKSLSSSLKPEVTSLTVLAFDFEVK